MLLLVLLTLVSPALLFGGSGHKTENAPQSQPKSAPPIYPAPAAPPARAPTSDVNGRLYDVGGSQLYVEISGSGPPIVFLHGGFSFFDHTFPAQKAYFSTFRTVIGIDQRGHGHSPDNDQPFSYSQMAEDTAEVLEQLNLSNVDIVGHSDGGDVALLLARYHPELVRRIVISGSNFRGDYAGLFAFIKARWLIPTSKFVATTPIEERELYDSVSPDGDEHWDIMAAKTKELWTTWSVINQADLAKIRTPVLVMAGDHDEVQLKHTMALFQALPVSQLAILPHSSHQTMIEHPLLFNLLTQQFLEQPER